MVANKKLKLLFFFIIAIAIILSISFFFLERRTKVNCDVVKLFNGFISEESPSSLSLYCDNHFSEDDCRIYFYDFILYEIKKNNFEILDPNSPHLQVFMNYLNDEQPGVIENANSMDINITYNFKFGVPIEDPNKEYIGLNAAITKNSSYCDLNKVEIERSYCIDEVKFLNAFTIEDCKNLRKFHLRLLCLRDISQEEYLAELNRCGIQ